MKVMPAALLPTAQWLSRLDAPDSAFTSTLRKLYGDDTTLLEERRKAYRRLLKEAASAFGADKPVLLSRAPARVNLMGRHVDHQGGFVNPIALNAEVIMAVHPRDDDWVVVRNVEARDFPEGSFRIADELPPRSVGVTPTLLGSVQEWDLWTMQEFEKRKAKGTHQDWVNYIKAACVYFQELNRASDASLKKRLKGMNVMVYGDIPLSAGLSSSSAVFVAAAEAIVALNDLTMSDEEFVEACGYGEWFVGTRGGSGDHAAMRYAKQGMVSHIGFFPTSVSYVPFPKGFKLVIFNSKEEAQKASGARDIFNQKVACYEFGLLLLKQLYPHLAGRMRYFRDINPQTLGVSLATVYEMLKSLPLSIKAEDLKQKLPHDLHELIDHIASQHALPKQGYEVRGVCLYGVAECERSRVCADLLQCGEVQRFGQMMSISHDGDRVVRHCLNLFASPHQSKVDDAHLTALASMAESDEWELKEAAALWRQPGSYRCSTERIDLMVDIALQTEGVLGAQLSGAGLGGCMMALVREDKVGTLIAAMQERYYTRLNLAPEFIVAVPVAGSGWIQPESVK